MLGDSSTSWSRWKDLSHDDDAEGGGEGKEVSFGRLKEAMRGRGGGRVAEVRTGSTIPSPAGWKALESLVERKEGRRSGGRRGEVTPTFQHDEKLIDAIFFFVRTEIV